MKIHAKRKISSIIDYISIGFAIGGALFILQKFSFIPSWFWVTKIYNISIPLGTAAIALPSILSAITFKDFVFKNASLGKKIMGLIILDGNWNVPDRKLMRKRGYRMMVEGFSKYAVYHVFRLDMLDADLGFEKWEFEKCGTRVVDKKVFAKLKSDCEKMSGDFKRNMDDMYHNYRMSQID